MPASRPLSRQTVTEGSILVLPSYAFVFCAVGLIFLFQSPARTASPAFDSAKWALSWLGTDPIRTWACIFLTIGASEIVSGLVGQRQLFTWLLVAGAGVCAFWATLLFWSASASPFVSFTAGVWVSHSGWCHIASIRSLSRDWVVKS